MAYDNWTAATAIKFANGTFAETDDAPAIAYRGTDIVCVFQGTRDPYIWFTMSSDAGATWSTPKITHLQILSCRGMSLGAKGLKLALVYRGHDNLLCISYFTGAGFGAPQDIDIVMGKPSHPITEEPPAVCYGSGTRRVIGWKPIADINVQMARIDAISAKSDDAILNSPSDIMTYTGPSVAYGERSGNTSLFRAIYRGLENRIYLCDGMNGTPLQWQNSYNVGDRFTYQRPAIAYDAKKEMWCMAWVDSSSSVPGNCAQLCTDCCPEAGHWNTPYVQLGNKNFWSPRGPALCRITNPNDAPPYGFLMAWQGFDNRIYLSRLALT